jgi:hypothetical protein
MRAMANGLMLMLAAVTSVEAADADTPTLQPFVATYSVSYRGLNAGVLTFELKRDGTNGRYIYETRADPSALASFFISDAANERSVMEIGPQAGPLGVRPLEWKLDDGKSGNKRDGVLHFDWSSNKVSGEIEGEKVDLPTEAGLQDRLSIQIAVTASLLRGIEPGTIPLVDDNRIKRYIYTKKEPAQLDSVLGKVDTILYESSRETSDRVSRFWMAPSLGYTPIRAEQVRKGKVETVMTLTSLQRSPP